jgi:hypothetical protein
MVIRTTRQCRSDNRRGQFSDTPFDKRTIRGFIDGHNIDFVKNKVAFDFEWNSKDQTFDRDLLAMQFMQLEI